MDAREFQVGEATVWVFDTGALELGLEEVFDPKVRLSNFFGRRELETPGAFPTHSFLIQSSEAVVVVDPSDYGRLVAPGHFKSPGGYSPPPPLIEQMEGAGVSTSDVTNVVITHLHFDHFAGVTRESGGRLIPTFPRARYLVPKRDWEMASIADARVKGDRDVTDTLGVIEIAGKMDLLDNEMRIGAGVMVEPFRGESPGHQIIGLKSEGDSCYCVGDLYHFKQEVQHPELKAIWTDGPALVASRRRFARRAAAEKALVLAGHLPPGRINMEAGRTKWSELRRR